MCVFIAAVKYLPIRCLETVAVYPPISQPLLRNGCTLYCVIRGRWRQTSVSTYHSLTCGTRCKYGRKRRKSGRSKETFLLNSQMVLLRILKIHLNLVQIFGIFPSFSISILIRHPVESEEKVSPPMRAPMNGCTKENKEQSN